MEGLEDPLLRRAVQIDQQIAARDQIEVRKRRILDDIVVREENHLAQFAPDPIARAFVMEEALEPLLGHVHDVGVGIETLARRRDRVLVEVGSEYLYVRRLDQPGAEFGQQHANGIRLLAGGAAGDPDTYLVVGILPLEQARYDALFEDD